MGVVLAASAGALVLGAGASADAPKPGEVITGSELGSRVDQVVEGRVVGKFVVRVNGEWKEPALTSLPREIPAIP